jgi:MFS family permease
MTIAHLPSDSRNAGTSSWLMRFSAVERRTFSACLGGCTLDNMNSQMFSLLIPTLIAAWSVTRAEAGLIASSTLLTGAAGGVIAGYLADRYGRVRILQVTIIWFSVFTVVCGFTENQHQLLWARALQGIGFGGELAVGAVLIGETIRPSARGTVMGLVATGYSLGALMASGLFVVLFAVLPATSAWRALFWCGAAPALLVLYIRRNLVEPERRIIASKDSAAVRSLFGGALTRSTLLGTLLVVGSNAAVNALFIWLPTFLKLERGLSSQTTGANFAATAFGMFVGCVVGAFSLDRFGRRPVFVTTAVLTVTLLAVYLLLPVAGTLLLILGFVLGGLAVASGVGISPMLAELFPGAIRATGLGFCYSVGRGIGALAPAIIGALSTHVSLRTSLAAFVGAGYLLVCVCVLLLPDRRGEALLE